MNKRKALIFGITQLLATFFCFAEIDDDNRDSLRDSLTHQADSLLNAGQFATAFQKYTEIIKSLSHEANSCLLTEYELRKSTCLIYLRQFLEAKEILEKQQIFGNCPNLFQEYHLLKGMVAYFRGNLDKSTSLLLTSISDSNSLIHLKRNSRALRFASFAFYQSHQLDSAKNTSLQYLSLIRKLTKLDGIPRSRLIKQTITGLGHLELERGQYSSALDYYRSWVEMAETEEDKSLALTYYGRTLIEIGAISKGLDVISHAIKSDTSRSSLNSEYLMGYTLLAESYLKLNQLRKADSVINKVFKHLPSSEEGLWLNATFNFIKGSLLFKQKSYENCIPYFRKTVRYLSEESPGSQMIPLSYAAWYNSLIETNQIELAKQLDLAIQSQISNSSSIHWLQLELVKARHEATIGMGELARKRLEKVLTTNTLVSNQDTIGFYDPWLQIQVYARLIEIYKKDPKPALSKISKYYQLIDLAANALRMSYLEYNDQVLLSDSLHQYYQDAFEHSYQHFNLQTHTDPYQLLFITEKSKSLSSYQELLLKHFKSTDFGNTTVKNDLKINQKLDYYYQLRFQNRNKSKEHQSNLEQRILELELKSEKTQQQIRKAAYPSKSFLMEKIRHFSSDFSDEQAIISYYFGPKHLYAFVINQKGIWVHQMAPSDSVHENISKLKQLTSRADHSNQAFNDYKYTSNRLYIQLFGKIPATQLRKKLIVIPDGALSQLPFDILTLDDSGSNYQALSYLFKKHLISYNQSLSIHLHHSKTTKTTNPKMLAVAPSQFPTKGKTKNLYPSNNRDFGQLAHNQQEAKKAVDQFGGTLLKDHEATESVFKDRFQRNAILHFATHAYNDLQEPSNSFILFQEQKNDSLNDGILFSWEIFRSTLPCNLVVLSACDTGIGKMYRGEGTQSLASSFFHAGAQSVMMSLWRVNDLTTSMLIGNFYDQLYDGREKDESLQIARQKFLEEADEIQSHPFYWGAFVIVGNTNALNKPNTHQWRFLLFILLIGICIYLMNYFKKVIQS